MRKKFIKHLSRNKMAYVIMVVLLVVGIASATQSVPNFQSLDNELTGNTAQLAKNNQVFFTSEIPKVVTKGGVYEVSWTSNAKNGTLYLVSEKTGKPMLLGKVIGNSGTFTLPPTVMDGVYYYGLKAGGLAKSSTFTVTNQVVGTGTFPNTTEPSSLPSTSTGTFEPKDETSTVPNTGIPSVPTTPPPTNEPLTTTVLRVGVNLKSGGFTVTDTSGVVVAKNTGADCPLAISYFTCQYVNLKKGTYTIDFHDVADLISPFDQTIEFNGMNVEVYGKYTK